MAGDRIGGARAVGWPRRARRGDPRWREAPAILDALLDSLRSAQPKWSSPRPSRSLRPPASPASRRATSSATGIQLCIRSRSRMPSSRACAGRCRPRSCAGCSTRAMSVHLDRFLNVPATRLPTPTGRRPRRLLDELPQLLDRQQQVDETGQLVASYLGAAASPHGSSRRSALRSFGRTATSTRSSPSKRRSRQHELLGGDEAGLPLLAAARYLAAHATTTAPSYRHSTSPGASTAARRSTRRLSRGLGNAKARPCRTVAGAGFTGWTSRIV